MVYAVDFDGTLCEDIYPEIGPPRQDVIDFIKAERDGGAKIILWTCRCGRELTATLEWCTAQGIVFDAINDNLRKNIERNGNNCRKVFADRYIDDRNFDIPTERREPQVTRYAMPGVRYLDEQGKEAPNI